MKTEKMPLIHRKFVITSTYCMKDRGIRFEKEKFIKANHKAFSILYYEYREKYKKWWNTEHSFKLEMKIRVKFGYSPRTYSYDIMNHFNHIFREYEERKELKTRKKV